MAFNNEEKFTINETGEVTGENFPGEFKFLLHLSHGQQLAMDARRRELLGSVTPEQATVGALNRAEIISELGVRITESPNWWKESLGGLTLLDDTPLKKVSDMVRERVGKARKEVTDRAEAAQKKLRDAKVSE